MITPPVESYDFLAHADEVHAIANYDFPTILDHYFVHGWIFKAPTHFVLGGHDPAREDAWLIWWAEVHPATSSRNMLRLLLRCMPYPKPWIGWARPLKGRVDVTYYSTERLIRFTRKPAGNP